MAASEAPGGAIIGSIFDLPRVATRNPAIEKEQMLSHGDLGHVTNFALAHHPVGEECGEHDHANMDEIFLVWRGTGTIVVDGVSHSAREGDYFALPVGVSHNIVSDGQCSDFQVLCIGIRARGHEGDDEAFWAAR